MTRMGVVTLKPSDLVRDCPGAEEAASDLGMTVGDLCALLDRTGLQVVMSIEAKNKGFFVVDVGLDPEPESQL